MLFGYNVIATHIQCVNGLITVTRERFQTTRCHSSSPASATAANKLPTIHRMKIPLTLLSCSFFGPELSRRRDVWIRNCTLLLPYLLIDWNYGGSVKVTWVERVKMLSDVEFVWGGSLSSPLELDITYLCLPIPLNATFNHMQHVYVKTWFERPRFIEHGNTIAVVDFITHYA